MPNRFDEVLDRLRETVSNVTGVVDSAVTFMRGLSEQLQAAIEQATSAGATEEQLAAFVELDTAIDAKMEELARAIAS